MTKSTRTFRHGDSSTGTESHQSLYGKSWAIVVGISDYTNNQHLPNARNDAQAIAAILRDKYSFDEIYTLYDKAATYGGIMTWLRDELPTRTHENDRVIFFFAGHGASQEAVLGNKWGYLVPYGAEFGKYAGYIDMADIVRSCALIKAKHIFIILDCCFSGIAALSTRSMLPQPPQEIADSYLRRITAKKAWQILTAGDSDDLVADSGVRPGHSIFTQVLLDGLEGNADQNQDNLFSASELAAYVKPRVARESSINSGQGQTPFFTYLPGSEQGDFVFILPYAPSVAGTATLAQQDIKTRSYEAKKHQSFPIDFDWVTIPAGKFLMGCDKQKDPLGHDVELPQHSLTLPEYRIARVPVTVAQFAQFIKATNYKTTAEQKGSSWGMIGSHSKFMEIKDAYWARPRGPQSDVKQKAQHPVTCVSWLDAVAFCQWAGVRLPTEAEWEKAARGTDGRIYPWGNDKPDIHHCNFKNKVDDTTPVNQYPTGASPYGVLDMAGNIWEWTSSLYKPYPYKAVDGREDPTAEDLRILRGGSFFSDDVGVRCPARSLFDPDVTGIDIGFRVGSPEP